MPQIPMVRRANVVRSGDNYAPVSGAPGPGWRTENGLDQLGRGIQDLGRGVGSAAVNLAELAEKKQRADDDDNLGQIGLEGQTADDDLFARLRENPNEYEQFDKWEEEAAGALSDRVKPYLEKLSPKARRRAELTLAQAAQKRKATTRAIAFQADITAKRGNYDIRIRHYAKTGNVESAREQLRQAEDSGIFSPNERESYENFIGEIADFGAVERRIEAGDPNVAEALRAREESGAPKEYSALSEESRKQLLRYAEQKRDRYEVGQRTAFVADIQAGKSISEEAVQKRTDIRQDVKNDFVKMLRDTQRAKSQRLSTERAAERKAAADLFEYDLLGLKWPSDPVERDKLYNEMQKGIYSNFLSDEPGYAAKLERQLKESRKAAEHPDSSYKQTPVYQYGTALIDQMKARKKFYSGYEQGWFRDTKETDKVTTDLVEKLVRLDLDHYLQAHPDATEEEARAYIEQVTADYNRTKVDGLADRSLIHAAAIRSAVPSEGRTGTLNGKKVIYRNGKVGYVDRND